MGSSDRCRPGTWKFLTLVAVLALAGGGCGQSGGTGPVRIEGAIPRGSNLAPPPTQPS